MKHGRLLLLLLCLSFAGALQAQQVTISGYVTEKKSGERLIGATVYIPEKNIGTSTNTFGFYSITIPADSLVLRAAYVGFQPFSRAMSVKFNTTVNIELEPAGELEEVEVTSQTSIQDRTQMSAIDLPVSTIKSLPAFLGEADVMKAIQLLPGVQAGSEGATGVYVRGGGPDQNLILLDGVPVYNASHLFGFFSVFNADAIKSVEVVKGGFPARYGGRLSSVIDIRMKDGDNNKIHGEGGIGLIASRLMLEGPIQKGKSSLMISGRRTYYDVIAQPFMRGNMKVGYFFYDLNGKLNFRLGKNDHLFISGYFGNDKFYAREKQNSLGGAASSNFNTSLLWGNATAVARWNHQFSPKVFGNLTAYYSKYNFNISSQVSSNIASTTDEYLLKYASGINDKVIKYDIDIFPSAAHALKIGAGFVAHSYTPGAQHTKVSAGTYHQDTTIGTDPLRANEYDVYVEDDIRISSRLKTNIGLHWTGFNVRGKFYPSIQPRASVRYLLSDALSAKASYAQMNQFIHLLTNSSIGLPTDLWLPVTDRVPAQRSQQVAAGLAYTHKTGIEMSIEGYYKDMKNIIEYKEGANFLGTEGTWEDRVEVGKGNSYGLELFLQKKKGNFTGMLGYTLSWTNRTFENLNNGMTFPYRYDRRHDFKVAAIYKLTKNIEASAEWVYGTGNALTLPTASYTGPDGDMVQVYGSRNGFRMPAYHRADVSIKFIKQRKHSERAWIISAYNVYNRRNPFYIYSSSNSQGDPVFKQVSLFPIIPSISYQFKF